MNKRLYVTHDEGKTYRTVNLGDVVPYIVRFIPHYAPWLNTAYGQHVFVHDHLAHKVRGGEGEGRGIACADFNVFCVWVWANWQ